MERYRTVGQNDDIALNEGDSSFVGVNEWDAPENLQPGQVQQAVNIDFTSQDAVTRGGFVALPTRGSTPFSGWASLTTPNISAGSVAYGAGKYVAIAASGLNNLMYSEDGETWISLTIGNSNLVTVIYGGDRFVAVGASGSIATSEDGIAWTNRTGPANTSTHYWSGLCYGNGLYVATSLSGSTGRVMTSPDGTTWTLRSSDTSLQWRSVAHGNNLYVAVANSGSGNRVMTSPDGTTWTQRASANNSIAWNAVTFHETAEVFVAVGWDGAGLSSSTAMTSADGISWTIRTSAVANNWRGLAYGAGLLVATSITGTGNRVMVSQDGISWTSQETPVDNSWEGVCFGGTGQGAFVAVSYDGSQNRAMKSSPMGTAFGTGEYSDPNVAGDNWVVIAGPEALGFYAYGKSGRTVNYAEGLTVGELCTIRQCNNLLYIFRGFGATPLYWDGNWAGEVQEAPDASSLLPGFTNIPASNQATYCQNRLWIIQSKDSIAASDVLDFTQYDAINNDFNLNTGDSDTLVTTYPFGDTTLLVFKNKSILALQNVDGALTDVTCTEITRQVGCIGINAVVSVGPDVVYMSDRNINLISLTDTNNSLQHQTLPLSRNIRRIIERVNWQYAYKVSMAYYDNKLYVALPLDNATSCSTVCVYNFVTQQWYGEWNFSDRIGMTILGWATVDYLGISRLHCVTEDSRVFVVDEGPNDISGTTVAEIATELTTRAYVMDNNTRVNRRVYMDMATWRPNFSVTAYSEGVSESTRVLTNQTFSRAQSWKWNDSTYTLTNANDDYNRAYRKDYATGPDSVQCGSGFLPQKEQEFRLPIITRRSGRLAWVKVENSQGLLRLMNVGFEARAGARNNLIQV